jgi:hypothetical protein
LQWLQESLWAASRLNQKMGNRLFQMIRKGDPPRGRVRILIWLQNNYPIQPFIK